MPRGRRPGSPATREAILDAARHEFASHGYERATVRGIAASAEVDPSLVLHYFGSKEQLFAAGLDLPMNPATVVRSVFEQGDTADRGQRLVAALLSVWDETADRSPFVAVLRSAAGAGPIADTVREFVDASIIGTFADILPGEDRRLRAALIGSQIAGLLLGRYVIQIEPLASANPDHLAEVYGPTIQRYAYEDLATG